nr:YlcI/YnfO family protein [uncultured Anaerostipes sp.]
MFKIKKTTSSSKTIRMPDPLIEELEKLAYQNEISFNQLVTQCCEYALKHIDKEDADEVQATVESKKK